MGSPFGCAHYHRLARVMGGVILLTALGGGRALASLSMSPLILDLAPKAPPRGDVELLNNGAERLYLVVEPSEIVDAGKPTERRVQNPDPEALGLLATPNRVILEPGERKFLRIALLGEPQSQDRIYRVTVKPVVGGVAGAKSGLKVMVGYDMLVIQRPRAPIAKLVSHRTADKAMITNTGDTNAELFQGKQCDQGAKTCLDLPSERIYSGASIEVPVRPGFTISYTVKVQGDVTTNTFAP